MQLKKLAIDAMIGLTEVLGLAVLLVFFVNSAQAQTKSRNAAGLIYERCHASVVVVVPLDKDDKPLGQGSGFIIAANKVVTNHHVLAESTNAVVLFADGGTERVEGFIADNPTRDITILSVRPELVLRLKWVTSFH